MRATIILENLASFKPFESSLKSSDPFDGRIKSLKGARPGRKGTTNFLCRQGTPLFKRDLGDTGNLIREQGFRIYYTIIRVTSRNVLPLPPQPPQNEFGDTLDSRHLKPSRTLNPRIHSCQEEIDARQKLSQSLNPKPETLKTPKPHTLNPKNY